MPFPHPSSITSCKSVSTKLQLRFVTPQRQRILKQAFWHYHSGLLQIVSDDSVRSVVILFSTLSTPCRTLFESNWELSIVSEPPIRSKAWGHTNMKWHRWDALIFALQRPRGKPPCWQDIDHEAKKIHCTGMGFAGFVWTAGCLVWPLSTNPNPALCRWFDASEHPNPSTIEIAIWCCD